MKPPSIIKPIGGHLKPLALGLTAAAAFFTTGPALAAGGLITPVAATAQSYYGPDDRAPVHAIDGSGMTPNSPVTASSTCGTGPGGNMWLSNGNQDTWATDNGIPGEPATGDFDHDGLTNLMEYALGKDPTASSQPAGELTGKVISFTKGTDAIANGDVSWVIEQSLDLGLTDPWAAVVTQAPGNSDATISHTLPAGAGKVFARLVVTIP